MTETLLPEPVPAQLRSSTSTLRRSVKAMLAESPLLSKARALLSNPKVPSPIRASDGVGGTYFLHDESRRPVAVFKPVDEEPGAANDAKRSLAEPLLPPGGGALREIAAFLLDQRMPQAQRAGVPETHWFAGVSHLAFVGGGAASKYGSLQRFVANDGLLDSLSPSLVYAGDVHRVAVLDLRLLNLDRNAENLLVQRDALAPNSQPPSPPPPQRPELRRVSQTTPSYHLVPVDHAYSLPPSPHGAFFEWQHWPQAKLPLSAEMREAIAAIDVDAEATMLRALGLEEPAVRTATLAARWLQAGVAEGLTPYQLASFVAAPLPTQPSLMEQLLGGLDSLGLRDATFRQLLAEVARLIKRQ